MQFSNMVELVEGRVEVHGGFLKVEEYMHEMLTLKGWWHRVNEDLNDYLTAKSETLLLSLGFKNAKVWNPINRIIVFSIIFIGYPALLIVFICLYILENRLKRS